jgi:D-sedoheptulose 7-phosphate isomerase
MKDIIKQQIKESIKVKEAMLESLIDPIEKVSKIIIECYKNKGKVVLFGNGGSAADAQHIASELVNKFSFEREPLPAIALTTDTSILTSISNDSSYDNVFERQIKAFCNKGDVAIAITTSDVSFEKGGHSANIAKAIIAAKNKGVKTIGLISKKGIEISKMVDLAIIVPSYETPRIQEAHITIGHIICYLVEKELFQ